MVGFETGIQIKSRHLFGTALLGMAILVFETTLTRIFSVTLWYYFGFLAISVAMLGLASGGIFAYAFPRITSERFESSFSTAAVLFAVASLFALWFHFNVNFVGQGIEVAFFLRLLAHV